LSLEEEIEIMWCGCVALSQPVGRSLIYRIPHFKGQSERARSYVSVHSVLRKEREAVPFIK
jgi:hypothetical protein